MTANPVAANPGSYRRRHSMTPAVAGSRTTLSTVIDAMQLVVMYEVPQALTDDDSEGQG